MNDDLEALAKKRQSVLLAGAVVFLAIAALIFQLVEGNKTKIEILAVPPDAKVLIDGKSSKTGKVTLEPGEYTFSASKEGYASVEQRVKVVDGSVVTLLLTPESEEAREWAEENRSLYLEAEAKAGERAAAEGDVFKAKNPIIDVLPYTGVLFRINYRLVSEASDRVILEIGGRTADSRAFAIQRIRDLGYEPTDYEIDFTDLSTNPLVD